MGLTIWSSKRSGGRPLGRRHDDGGVEARTPMAWVRVADGICVRMHLGVACRLLSLEVVVRRG